MMLTFFVERVWWDSVRDTISSPTPPAATFVWHYQLDAAMASAYKSEKMCSKYFLVHWGMDTEYFPSKACFYWINPNKILYL